MSYSRPQLLRISVLDNLNPSYVTASLALTNVILQHNSPSGLSGNSLVATTGDPIFSHTGDTVETTAYTYTITAPLLANNGGFKMLFKGLTTDGGSPGNRTIKVKIGSTVLYTLTVTAASVSAPWQIDLSFLTAGSSTKYLAGSGMFGIAGAMVQGPFPAKYESINTDTSQDLTVTFTLANGADTAILNMVVIQRL